MQVYRCPFPNIPRCANTRFGHKNSMKDHVLVNHRYFSTCESNADMLAGTYTQTRMSVERWKSECIRRKKGEWRKFVQEALDAQLAAAQAVPVAPVLPPQAAAAPSPYLPPVPTRTVRCGVGASSRGPSLPRSDCPHWADLSHASV